MGLEKPVEAVQFRSSAILNNIYIKFMAFLSKYTVCKRYFDDIWGDIFFRKKTAKFGVKVMLKMRKRPHIL